jgi:hypothetical protein
MLKILEKISQKIILIFNFENTTHDNIIVDDGKIYNFKN